MIFDLERIIELVGLAILLSQGTFIKTRFFNYAKGMFAFVLLGILFKIQHWSYANVLISFGWTGILIVYAFSFIKKSAKRLLDFLKLLWLLIVVPKLILHLYHYPYVDILNTASLVTMSLALMVFFREKLKISNRL